MDKKILLLASVLGAVMVERYAGNSTAKFVGGAITGVVANLLAWKSSVPKNPMIMSGILAGVGATHVNGMMKWINATPKTASALGVFVGSTLYSLFWARFH
jgi:ABC-type enterobactin transport system permease subunit